MKRFWALLLTSLLTMLLFTGCGADVSDIVKDVAEDYIDDNYGDYTDNDSDSSDGEDYGSDNTEEKVSTVGNTVMIEKGSVENWPSDCSIPYFLPIGDYNKYESVDYSSDDDFYCDSTNFQYLSEDDEESYFCVYGQPYSLHYCSDNVNIGWIKTLAQNMGATIYKTNPEVCLFYVKENEKTGWFVYADVAEGERASITEMKVNLISDGQTRSLDNKDLKMDTEGKTYVYIDDKSTDFTTLTVNFSKEAGTIDDGLEVYYQGSCKEGKYSQWFEEHQRYSLISPIRSKEVTLNSIPKSMQMSGVMLYAERMPEGVTADITAHTVGSLEAVNYGDKPGMIKVIGSGSYMKIAIANEWNCDYYIDDFESTEYEEGIVDADGNTCFTVPAGYYSVILYAEDTEMEMDAYQHFVPVNAGRITEVTIPNEFIASFDSLAKKYSYDNAQAGNMEVEYTVDLGDEVQLGIMIYDPEERQACPEVSDFVITENGEQALVKSVEQVAAGVDIVLCLDSSGSMRKDMQTAIDSAKKFVENLPDNSRVSLIQFEQKIYPTVGNDKETVLAALDKVKAGGDTSMYDAVSQAIDYLRDNDAKSPYVIVFSDGADSREPGVSGEGSSIDLDEICSIISDSDVTVLTIGFGDGHDPKALIAMSEACANGEYYVAADAENLDNAFANASTKFGSQFLVTYERPTIVKNINGEVPVVSMMLDMSGSMDIEAGTEDDDTDFRIDKVRNIFTNFVNGLPDNTMMQLNTFQGGGGTVEEILGQQISTYSKEEILRSLARGYANGGTPILDAIDFSYTYLRNISSDKRVLVFFTDAALDVGEDEVDQALFEKYLTALKINGIRTLFVGLGGAEYASQHDAVFKHAAELSGGDYIITSSTEAIEKKLVELQTKINDVISENEGTSIIVNLNCMTDSGERVSYSANYNDMNMQIKTKTGDVVNPGVAIIKDGGKLE